MKSYFWLIEHKLKKDDHNIFQISKKAVEILILSSLAESIDPTSVKSKTTFFELKSSW